jgi:sulfate transport system ATP-binding protein
MIARVVHLGFEVRVELVLADGAPTVAQLTRAEADALELRAGDVVYVRPLNVSSTPRDRARAA